MKAVLVLETVHVSLLKRLVKCRALCVGPLNAWTGRSTARSMATLGERIRARREPSAPRGNAECVTALQALYSGPAPRAVLPLRSLLPLQVPNDCRSTAHRCLPFAHRYAALCTRCVRVSALRTLASTRTEASLARPRVSAQSKVDEWPGRVVCAHIGQAQNAAHFAWRRRQRIAMQHRRRH